MIGWLLNLVYGTALMALAPVLAYQRLWRGKVRKGWAEKLWGAVPLRSSSSACIWLHAVSVGEVLLLRTVVAELRRLRPDADVWISTTTTTGHDVAVRTFPDCRVIYFPFDFTWAVRRALRRIRPDLIGLVELEIWPNFIRAADDLGVPVVLINGRISERSFRGYRRIKSLIAPTLRRVRRFAVQTAEFAERLQRLGAPAERVLVTGSIKFDGLSAHSAKSRTQALRRELGIAAEDLVLMAGSTHDPEERLALETYHQLKSQFPNLRLVLAPRHRERFDAVADVIAACGLPCRRRSASHFDAADSDRPVLLLDTLGELSTAWGLANVAFVGGSFTRRGGQNMLEPAACGAAVLVGPHTWNFREIVELLRASNAIRVVDTPDRLSSAVRDLLADGEARSRLAAAARQLIQSHQGATESTVDAMLALIGDRPAANKAA